MPDSPSKHVNRLLPLPSGSSPANWRTGWRTS